MSDDTTAQNEQTYAVQKTEDEWRALGRALGSPPWCAEGRFQTLAGRKEHEDELDRLIEG